MKTPTLLDGAMGTELQRRGVNLPLPLWSADANLTHPEIVLSIHQDYIDAGADIITTNTFRSTTWTYRKVGYSPRRAQDRARESLFSAVDLARKAAQDDHKIAGSLTALEDCYLPERFPGRTAAEDVYGQTVEWFETAGVDLLLFETMGHPEEINTALEMVQGKKMKRWLSLILKDEGHLLEGSNLDPILTKAKWAGVACVLLNCNTVQITEKAVPGLMNLWESRWGVYPNLGLDQPEPDGTIHVLLDKQTFLAFSSRMVEKGASVLGSCCGSTPEHIKFLRERFPH